MYTSTDLPANYRGGAFVGEHGSWNRTPLNGYKVVFVPFSGGKPSGPAQDVVTGFLDANNHARGRPVGLAVDRSGGLLVGRAGWNTGLRGGWCAPQTSRFGNALPGTRTQREHSI